MKRVSCLLASAAVGAALATAVATWIQLKSRRAAEAQLVITETRLAELEAEIAKCGRPPKKRDQKGDFPPWHGKEPAGERNLLSPHEELRLLERDK